MYSYIILRISCHVYLLSNPFLSRQRPCQKSIAIPKLFLYGCSDVCRAVVRGIATTTPLALAPLSTFVASAFGGTVWNCLNSSLMRFSKNILIKKYFNGCKSKLIHKLKYILKQNSVFLAYNGVLKNCSFENFNTMTVHLFSSRR